MSMGYPKQRAKFIFGSLFKFLRRINSVHKNFCSHQYLLNEFIEEFVSDIVAEGEIRLDETRQLFVVGNNGVGKSTFKAQNYVTNFVKTSGAEVQIIEANNKGYTLYIIVG